MKPAPKIHIDSFKTNSARMMPAQEANGDATGTSEGNPPSVADVLASKKGSAAASVNAPTPRHQTHGAILPTGPISSVSQLSGRPVARGSIGSFNSIAEYRGYLEGLTLGELHRHAVEEAKIVPIDDRSRLIRRLEGEYTAIASRTPGRVSNVVTAPKPYSQQQLDILAELQRKALNR